MSEEQEKRLRELVDEATTASYDYGFAAAAGSPRRMKYTSVGEAMDELIEFVRELTGTPELQAARRFQWEAMQARLKYLEDRLNEKGEHHVSSDSPPNH